MEVISLFAGCGGLDLGFRKAGFNVIWANEYDTSIHETYRCNHPQTFLNTSDIRTLDVSEIPDCDGIIGGPPCQSWSLGGKSLGLNDARGRLMFDYIRIVKGKRPKFFIMENVPGMLSSHHIQTFHFFLKMFREIGYIVKYELVNSSDFQIPQDRVRIIVVGIRNDINAEYFFPVSKQNSKITLQQAIGDLKLSPKPYNTEMVKQNNEIIQNHDYYTGAFDRKFMARNRVRSWDEQSYTIQAQAKNEPLHPQAPKMVYVSYNERKFVQGFESKYRRLSVRECARIQTFPDSFYFYYKDIRDGYKMVGNAVPPRLAFVLAMSIKECINKYSNHHILVGYVKNLKDLSLIRQFNVYYVRGGKRIGAVQYGQIEKNIEWLYLHHGEKKWAFELTNEKVLPCDKDYLKKIGFNPRGNEYWLFHIKKEISDITEIAKQIEGKYELSKKPFVL